MFIPFKVPDFQSKVLSLYKAAVIMSAGSAVDIDTTDTTAVASSVGYTALMGGSVKLASIATTNPFPRELGYAIPTVNQTGPSLEERILELASSYMTIPVGYALAVYVPSPGDMIATDQYVGNLSTDTGAAGLLDTTQVANFGAACGIFQGRFRLAQAGDVTRARWLGNTTGNGVSVALFQLA